MLRIWPRGQPWTLRPFLPQPAARAQREVLTLIWTNWKLNATGNFLYMLMRSVLRMTMRAQMSSVVLLIRRIVTTLLP